MLERFATWFKDFSPLIASDQEDLKKKRLGKEQILSVTLAEGKVSKIADKPIGKREEVIANEKATVCVRGYLVWSTWQKMKNKVR